LGHAFNLDALSFGETMYVGLYAVLGQLLAMRAARRLTSEWADSIIDDLARTCAAVRPRLRRWLYVC
jgi:hypothetical protein